MMGHHGQAQMDPSAALRYMGTQYRSAKEALAEYPWNGFDAIQELSGEGEVHVIYEPGKISIIDNGCGMLGRMLPLDAKKREDYYAALNRGEIPSGPLQDQLSDLSKHTLEYFVTNYGRSAKATRKGGKAVAGTRGVGSLAFQMFADKMILYTRPAPELAERYWEEAQKQHAPASALWANSQTITLRLDQFTRTQLHLGQRPYYIEDDGSVSMLTDAFGDPMEHGTRVEITDLDKGVLTSSLSIENVREYLGSRFGNQLRSGNLKLAIVDRFTQEARDSAQGFRIIPVEPTRYTGALLCQEVFSVRDPQTHKAYQAEIEVHWDPNIKGRGLELHRMAFNTGQPVSAVEELNRDPWNRGDLSGFVRWTEAPESIAPWNTDKTLPLESGIRDATIKALLPRGREIIRQIKESQERQGSERSHEINRVLSDILSDTLSTLGIADVTKQVLRRVVTPPPPPPPPPSSPPPPEIMTDVQVRVINEHGRGREGVEIILDSIRSERTGRRGRIVFGRLPKGRHQVSIVVPQGVELQGTPTREFNLSVQDPGVEITFRLKTGEPATSKPGRDTTEFDELPGLIITQQPLSDPDQPYDGSKLDGGTLIINSETAAFKVAHGDDEAEIRLKLEISAMALTEYLAEKRHEVPDLQLMWDMLSHGIIQTHQYLRRARR